jgi:GPH family glycoside/pentoside/hexuronide:cation symporter
MRRLGREMRDALRNDSFRPLFLGLLVFFIARGIEATLYMYMGVFFWRLTTDDVLLIPVMGMVGLALGTPLWAVVGRWLDKRRVFIFGIVWFSVLTFMLPVPKILGIYPPPESPLYVAILYAVIFLGAVGGAGALVAAGSMLADIADEHELQVGHRQEGIFFGAISFSGKAAVGIGSALAGFALTFISFPLQVAPDAVAAETVLHLGLAAGPGVAVLMTAGIVVMSRYRLTRERVAEIQAELAKRKR